MAKEIKNCAIIGMGALGMLYAAQMVKNISPDCVSFILDEDRMERYRGREYTVNGEKINFQLQLSSSAKPYDLVIVAVKYTSLPSALETMKNCVGKDTVIISVMNGVTSEKIIAERYGEEKLIYSIAQGMDAMHFGNSLTYNNPGKVLLGITDEAKREKLEVVKNFLERAKIPYVLPDDILHALWGKFLLNVGVNQACFVYNTTYGGVLKEGEPNRVMIAAMREVIAIAEAEGVKLTEDDLNFYVGLEAALPEDSMPSMAQDRLEKRPSEVDMFAGTIIELAKKHNIFVPTNEYLYKRAKEIEANY